MTAPSFHAGIELEGRYRLVAPLGKGGMGEVWEAEHMVLRRTVAIKLVLPDSTDTELGDRLQREAMLVARLEHPNIVSVTDFGLVAARQPFVVMERLVGRTLSQLLREQGALAWTQARDIAVQIAAGLACAHQAGIVHRDLKPSNVFVLDDPHGRLPIKIIDFGLAKATQLGPGHRALTRSGAVFGTPAYMAPEQVRGEPLDGRADLYAVGAILYEMIVGERLWQRESVPQLLYCHLFEPAPTIRARVPDVPPELDAIAARCLCKDRAMRPIDAETLRLELVGAGAGKGATVVPHDRIPVPAPELRARYATIAPGEHARPHVVGAPRAEPRRWIVPTIVAGVVATAGIVAALQLRAPADDVETPSEAVLEREAAPAIESAAPPSIEPLPSEAAPRESPPAVGTTPPRPPDPPASPPVDTANATSRDKPRARARPRAPSNSPTPAPDPVQPEPAKPPVPERKGDTMWAR